MAKTATGDRSLSSVFFLGPHYILETVTKSATKAANSKTTKAGEFDVYICASFTVSRIVFLLFHSSQLLLTTLFTKLRQAQARALRLSDLLQREHEEMERGESRPC